jgi:hypothetical protein
VWSSPSTPNFSISESSFVFILHFSEAWIWYRSCLSLTRQVMYV